MSLREATAFLLLGLLLPCLFLAFSGTPSALGAWCAAWIVFQLTERRHAQ